MPRYFKCALAALLISYSGTSLQAGGLSEPITEAPVAEPEVPFEPAQGSVNGGYILLGAFVIMALAAGAGN